MVVSCSMMNTDARRSSVGHEEELDVKSEKCSTQSRHLTYSCDDHQPVVEAKRLDHSQADIAPQQTCRHGRCDKGNVDCKQLGASVWDGHVVGGYRDTGSSRSKEPRRDKHDARGGKLHLRSSSALPVWSYRKQCIIHAATSVVGHCAGCPYCIQGLVRFRERPIPRQAFTRGAKTTQLGS